MLPGQNVLDLISHHTEAFNEVHKRSPWAPGLPLTHAFQSAPRFIAQESARKVYNAFDMDPDMGDYIWVVYVSPAPIATYNARRSNTK